MRKTCGGWGERRVLFCFSLFSFRDVPTIFEPGTGYEMLTSLVYVFTTESHLPLAGNAPHVSRSVPKVISKHSTKPNQGPKVGRKDRKPPHTPI